MSHLFDLGPSVPGTSRNDLWHGKQQMPWGGQSGGQTGFSPNVAKAGGFNAYQTPWFGKPNFSSAGKDTFNGFSSSGVSANREGMETRQAKSSPMQQVAMEGLKMTAAIAMGSLGFFLAGPGGAMVLGGMTAGGLSALSSWREEGQVDLLRAGMEGFLGAIPGAGQLGAKVAGGLGRRFVGAGIGATLQRGFVAGMVDGGLIGGLKGGLDSIFEDLKQQEFNPLNLLNGLVSGAVWGAVFGGAVGSAASALGRWRIRTRPGFRARDYKPAAQERIYGDSVAFSRTASGRAALPSTPASRGADNTQLNNSWH